MTIHILGIAGTFMSALALIAREAGFSVTGSDEHCYPPVSDLLDEKGIVWTKGYEDCSQALAADQVIIGNAMKRGMPVVEAVLNARKPYYSGPEWLARHILSRYSRVVAIAGTHGKTTTTSMLAWIADQAGLSPGFLIGGVASNFRTSARLGKGDCFIIEADEYDSAFFDKRPKFMHYRPQIAVLNNLEFDHADIYPNLSAIKQQFHYLLKTIPSEGVILKPVADEALNDVLAMGKFCQAETLSLQNDALWQAQLLDESGSAFIICYQGQRIARIEWSLMGRFNVENALAAFAASYHLGVNPQQAAMALSRFVPVKRRLEVKASGQGITLYDDFAHHPSAIAKTITALKASGRHKRVLVVLEFASFTMRTGVHAPIIGKALALADKAFILAPSAFALDDVSQQWTFSFALLPDYQTIVNALITEACAGDAIVVMSNRDVSAIHHPLSQYLNQGVILQDG